MKTKIESKLVKNQTRVYGPKIFVEDGETFRITATARYDDQCGNGHNSFSLTADIESKSGNRWQDYSGGCCHEEIEKHFPELAPFIKWHLMSSDEPIHYAANTIYLAGDRDCNGLRKGEFRQHTSRGQQNEGVAGVPNWILEIPDGFKKDVYCKYKPSPISLEWKAYGRTGEGKEPQLEAARRCAIWPDATLEQLTNKELLIARLPQLQADFKAAMESLGFTF